MKIARAAVLLCALFLAWSCGQQDTGNFKITLKLPENLINDCKKDSKYEDFVDDFCIVNGDSVELSIFSTDDLSRPYVFDETRVLPVGGLTGSSDFSSLRSNRYYRFFVKVTNTQEKVKLTGGAEGILYEDTKNYEINIFLGLTGDFVRVVSEQSDKTSLSTYFTEDDVPSGSRAVVLKDGRIVLTGGSIWRDSGSESYLTRTNYIDMAKLTVTDGPSLRMGVKDHVAALLETTDAKGALSPKTGKVVIAFGKTQDGYNDKIYLLDPEKNTVEQKVSFTNRAHARALTIGGEVYISGGCDSGSASRDIIKVDKKGNASSWKLMEQGRCLHGMIDVSWVTTDDEGVETLHPAILVFGGAKKYINTDQDKELIGYSDEAFAEVIDEGGTQKITVAGVECVTTGAQTSCTSLAGFGAARVKWDDPNKGPNEDIVVAASGGFTQTANDQPLSFSIANYILRGTGDLTNPKGMTWALSSSGTAIRCAYATMVPISSPDSFTVQYTALNCGTGKSIERNHDARNEQYIYSLEVRAAGTPGDFDLSASARASVNDGSIDNSNSGYFLDGPTVVNDFGQAFLFGTRYIYVISGFSDSLD